MPPLPTDLHECTFYGLTWPPLYCNLFPEGDRYRFGRSTLQYCGERFRSALAVRVTRWAVWVADDGTKHHRSPYSQDIAGYYVYDQESKTLRPLDENEVAGLQALELL